MPAKHHTIALCGYAGTGKDTVAQLLCVHAGFRSLAFADALRREIADAYQIPASIFIDRDTKGRMLDSLALCRAPKQFTDAVIVTQARAGMPPPEIDFYFSPRTPRQIMQWWGTEYRRNQDPYYWVRALEKRIDQLESYGENRFVITDLRFGEEHLWLTGRAGHQLWQIRRPGIGSARESGEGEHASATDGTQFAPDLIINNNHDIRHLQGVVLNAFVDLDIGLSKLHPSHTGAPIAEAQTPYLADQGPKAVQSAIDKCVGDLAA